MGVAPNSPVNAPNTNQAFLDANADDVAVGIIGLQNTDVSSGSDVVNVQGEINGGNSFSGRVAAAGPDSLPPWANNDVGTSLDSLFARVDALTQKFNNVNGVGHGHTGAGGDAPRLDYNNALTGPQLKGCVVQGTNLTSVTGTSKDVSSQLTGETHSTGVTVEGVVVTNPYNLVHLFDVNDNSFLDALGNKVYGRLTYSASVWTLSFYSEIAGTETAYTFASSTVKWYYQKLFNETNRPVYSEQFTVVSDQLAGEIPDATTSVKGKVKLYNSTPAADSGSGSAGSSSDVAKGDHVHPVSGFDRSAAVATITDGTSSTVYSVSATGLSGLKILYTLVKGANSRIGEFLVVKNGTSVSYLDMGTEFGDCETTFTADISGGNFRLLQSNISNGSNGTFNYEVTKIPA